MKVKLIRMASTIVFGLGLSTVSLADESPVRIGFVTDMSGVYADLDGPGGAEAIKMAIEDFGGTVNGRKIELLVADHQNKADIAAARARQWYDEGVDMIIGGTNSSANLAILHVAVDKKRFFFRQAHPLPD